MLPEADGRFLPSYTRVVVVVVAVVHAGRSGDRRRAVLVLCFLVFGFWCLVLGLGQNFFLMKTFWFLVLVFGIGVWYWVGVSKKKVGSLESSPQNLFVPLLSCQA